MRRIVIVPLLLLLAACGYDATPVPTPEAEAAASAPTAPPPPACNEPTRSYAPEGTVDELRGGRTVQEIRRSGRLVAGVSADSFLLGFRDPGEGKIVGFDIDMVTEIARAIFQEDDVSDRIALRVITAADRIPALVEEQVDIVARNMTINCARWDEIAFSAVYYQSGQKLLVRKGLEKRVTSVADLSGLRVCAPLGTTSLANITDRAPADTEIVTALNHTGCLVQFQRGEADAITGDDTVLAGLAAQDPYAIIPAGQKAFSQEPYGIGVNENDVDLVRFVNAVLEQMRGDGSWQRSYDKWLAPTLGIGSQPQPTYGR